MNSLIRNNIPLPVQAGLNLLSQKEQARGNVQAFLLKQEIPLPGGSAGVDQNRSKAVPQDYLTATGKRLIKKSAEQILYTISCFEKTFII